jgi:hypothetical protein
MPGTALPLTGRPSGSKGGLRRRRPRRAEPPLPPTFVCAGYPLVHMAATETWRWHQSTASLPEIVAAGGEHVATRRTRLWHGERSPAGPRMCVKPVGRISRFVPRAGHQAASWM